MTDPVVYVLYFNQPPGPKEGVIMHFTDEEIKVQKN